jgi:hypothetical protein
MFRSAFESSDGLNLWCYGVRPQGVARARTLSKVLVGQGFRLPTNNAPTPLPTTTCAGSPTAPRYSPIWPGLGWGGSSG